MIKVFTNGQSNAVGKTLGGNLLFSPDHYTWNNENGLNSATLNLGSAFVAPTPSQNPFYTKNGNSYNNALMHFCSKLAAAASDEVYHVHSAKGGQNFAQWMDTSGVKGPMYIRDKNVIDQSGVTLPFDIFARHQGENDDPLYGGTPSDLATAWPLYKAALIADGIIDANTVILLGETKGIHTGINPVLRDIAANDAQIAFVPLAGFEASDNVHFDGRQCLAVGLSYLEALSAHPGTAYTNVLGTIPTDDALDLYLGDGVTGVAGNAYYTVKFKDARHGRKADYDPDTGIWTPLRGIWNVKLNLRPINISGTTIIQAVLKRNDGLWRRFEQRPNGIGCSCYLDFDVVSTGYDEYEFCTYAGSSVTYDFEARDVDNHVQIRKR
ncbi:hypothetical protein JY97_14825 [Alkalispirochaeta odontotermitis]|nr:hypothetical protein JY97_14825 [Alkalispirochaeta odontotermitis]